MLITVPFDVIVNHGNLIGKKLIQNDFQAKKIIRKIYRYEEEDAL